MDVSNTGCAIGVQYNLTTRTTNTFVDPKPSTEDKTSQDYHLTKPVKSFRGRGAELKQLRSWLFQDKKKMAVICGLPAYGKTELARHLAHHCKEHNLVRSVLWLNAETPGDLEQSLRDLLRWLGARDKADLDVQSVVQAVQQHFKAESHLFILDNALDRRNVLGFEPEGLCFGVVTSHLEDWGDDVPSLQLMPLSTDSAVDVLRAELLHRFQDKDLEQYKYLVQLLSCVPLALQVAAAYVRQEVDDLGQLFHVSDYVERLQVPSAEVIDQPLPDSSANTYDKTFLQAIQISFHKIQNATNYDSKLATDILHICAYLNPEQIFYSTLLDISHLKKEVENYKDPKKYLIKTCALLCKYSFISVENEKISVHRLIQLSVIQINCQVHTNLAYFSCLKFLLDSFSNSKAHSHFILKYAEHRLDVFNKFYITHKYEIINESSFFAHLIYSNSTTFLVVILDDLKDGAADVINTRCLLHCAVRCVQRSVLQMLLEKYKPDVDHVEERSGNKVTPMIIAAWFLDLRTMKILAEHKANVNGVNMYGDTILHVIVRASGSPENFDRPLEAMEAVQWLVDNGARIDAVGRFDMTLVHTAAEALNPVLVRCLVEDHGCDVNALHLYKQTPLYYVVTAPRANRRPQQDTVRCLLDLGARLDVKDIWHRTPVEHARNHGQPDLADFIQDPSIDMKEIDPIMYELQSVVVRGDLITLTRLLDGLGDRALQIANESYLLFEAVLHKEPAVAELLLARGVDVDYKTTIHNTPLHRAATFLNVPVIKLLVEHGADVNAVDGTGNSVLHKLVQNTPGTAGRSTLVDTLRWLVDRGACIDAVTSHGTSLLHDAAYALNADLVRCLVTEYHLDVNAVTNIGWTPLFCVSDGLRYWRAEESRGLSTAACLLELGACALVRDHDGYVAADNARGLGYAKLAAVLDAAVAPQTQDSGQSDTAEAAVEDGVQVQLRRAATATAAAAVAAVCAWKFLRF